MQIGRYSVAIAHETREYRMMVTGMKNLNLPEKLLCILSSWDKILTSADGRRFFGLDRDCVITTSWLVIFRDASKS